MLRHNIDPVGVNRIDWFRVAPVLQILKASGNAFRIRILVPCLLLLIVVSIGYARFHRSVLPFLSRFDPTPSPMDVLLPATSRFLLPAPLNFLMQWPPLVEYDQLLSDTGRLLLLLAFTTLIAVAVSRSTSQDFCARSRTGVFSSCRFSLENCLAGLGATGLVTAILLAMSLPPLVFQWSVSGDGWLKSIAMLFSVPLAIYGLVAAFSVYVVLGAWLLSLAAIGTDRCGAADAVSRSISYLLTHKLIAAAYFYVAIVVSLLTRLVAALIVQQSLATNPDFEVLSAKRNVPTVANASALAAHWLLSALPVIVQLGTFLSATTIIYVLLRQKVDGIDLDEVDGGRNTITAKNPPPATSAGLA